MVTEITFAAEQLLPSRYNERALGEHIVAGNCVLFIGPTISVSTSRCPEVPSRVELTKELLTLLRDKVYLSPGDGSFPWVAQCYEIEWGRASLLSFLKGRIRTAKEPLPLHRAIASLPFPLILTTNYDILLETALQRKGKAYHLVIGGDEVGLVQPGAVKVVKLYGCVTGRDSMVVTEEDCFTFLERWPRILDALERELSHRAFLFIGCDLRDHSFRQLYHHLYPRLDKVGPVYAIQMGLPEPLERYWATRGLTVIKTDALEFLEGLAKDKPYKAKAEEAPYEMASKLPKLEVAKLTTVGRVRSLNEDCLEAYTPSAPHLMAKRGSLFIVADGVGGHNAGEIASRLAVDVIMEEYYADIEEDIPASLVRAIRKANKVIHQQAGENHGQVGMCTTVVAAAVRGRELHVANVGNSRLYLIRDRAIEQVTLDDSWVWEEVRKGRMTPEQARVHPQRDLLTRALGLEPEVDVHLFRRTLREGDIILLCSDGLFEPNGTEYVEDHEIRDIVSKHSPQSAVEQLVRMANDKGGADNISVIIVKVGGETTEKRSALQRAIGRLGLR